MVIIIEGPDRVGKDSLIRNLNNRFYRENLVNIHYSAIHPYDKKMPIRELSENINRTMFNLLNTNFNFILNRAHLGEMVYAPKYRNYPGDYVFELEKNLKRTDVFLILLTDSPETLAKRDDGKSISNKVQDIENEIELFRKALKMSGIKNKLEISCCGKTKDQVASEAIKFIENKV